MNQYKLIWSPKSKSEYANLLQYIEKLYGTDAALDFLDQVERIVESISVFPYAFPISDKVPSFRKAVINRQTSLFYRVNNQAVEIVHFWDNRQDLQ